MADPAWPSSPPEANYLRLVGPGAAGTATTLASAAAWQALMGSSELAFSASALNTAVTAVDFVGVGGLSSAASATGLNAALQLLAGWAQEKSPVATSAVSAYQSAVSAMIPAEVSLANRAEQAADVAMNPLVFGALTPAIVALDAEYFGEHWPHNAAVGSAYGAALAGLVAALSVPPPLSPPGSAPAGPAAAAALAEDLGQVAAGPISEQVVEETGRLAPETASAVADVGGLSGVAGQVGQFGSMLAQPVQAAMGATAPLAGMFGAPLQSLAGLAGLLAPSSAASRDAWEADPEEFDGSGAAGLDAGSMDSIGALGTSPNAVAGGGLGAAGLPGGSALSVQPSAGAGLATYTRPQAGFESAQSGRPLGLRPGLLSTAMELPVPLSSTGPIAPPALVPPGKDSDRSDPVDLARVELSPGVYQQG